MTIDLSPLIAEVDRRHADALAPKLGPGKQRFPRASSIGECSREIYHAIVNGDKKPDFAPDLMDRFDMGNEIERIVTRRLLDEGWKLSHQQVDFEIIEPYKAESIIICTGHYDGRIEWNGCSPVYEIKSLNPNVWGRIESFADFKRMGGFWTKYIHQMLIYLYKHSEEAGLFILHDCLGHLKLMPVYLMDWLDDCERALQTARAAAIGVATRTPPAYHKNPAVCMKCWAREAGVCAPPLDFSGAGIRVVDDPDIIEAIRTMEVHDAAATEYDAAKKIVDARFKASGAGQYMVGDYLVTTKEAVSVSYKVPDDVKAPYAVEGKRVTTRWERASL